MIHLIDYGPVVLASFDSVCFLDNSSQAMYLQALPPAAQEYVIANVIPACKKLLV